jgi:two-component system cell cycle sensor histidine kinase/response regulator CckA
MSSASRTLPAWDGDDCFDAVLAREARYRDIVENANDLIVAGDLEERIVSVNTAFERALGYSREELIGRPLASLVTPAWQVQLQDAAAAKLSGRSERTVYDLEFVARDGHAVQVEVSSWLVRQDGRPSGFQAICRDVSEWKEAEKALRGVEDSLIERENILERAFENTAIGMVIVSLDGHVISANRAFADLVGHDADELRDVNLVDISHPDDRHAVAAVIPRLLAGRVTRVSTEKRFVRKDGTPVWVQMGISPVRNGAGEVTCFVSQVVDATAKRDAVAAVRESEELFRTAFEGAAIGMLMSTPHGNIVRANAALCDLLGYSLGELRRIDVAELTHPDDRGRTTDALERFRHGDVSRLVSEKRYLRKDGQPVWVQIAVSAVHDTDGRLRCHVTQVVDLTARRESEERFRLLFESSPQGIAVVAPDGRLLQVNAALERILGYDRNELVGVPFAEYTHPDDRAADVELYAELMAGTRSFYELEKRFERSGGAIVWGHITVFRLPGRPGGSQLAIGILADITERRELEEQLRQSQRMEAIGRLAGGVAHDFNNLLMAIASYCDLAEDGRVDTSGERLRTSIGGIRSAAGRAAELTQQLLAFSRRQVLELAPLDVNAVVAEHAPMIQRLLGEDVAVRLSLDPDVATVTMDAGQLVQVVMNLAVNARDAMADGGTLTIETENVELDCAPTTSGCVSGPHVLLAVSDTGSGIDAETQARMFEPFFTTKETGGGTGLGLSTVLGIVEQSGGRLSVYSESGVGTTFKIYMPSLAGTARAEAPAAPEAGERPPGCERILLVEDNDAVRAPLAAVLADLGYDVLAAPGPEEARRLAEGAEIDLLVTDVVMPVMNGRQLAERLLPDHEGMHVLYISGYTDDAVIARGVIDLGTAFLQKPFGADRLAQKIRELLDAV